MFSQPSRLPSQRLLYRHHLSPTPVVTAAPNFPSCCRCWCFVQGGCARSVAVAAGTVARVWPGIGV